MAKRRRKPAAEKELRTGLASCLEGKLPGGAEKRRAREVLEAIRADKH